MAAYFDDTAPGIELEGLQTLYLMNPSYAPVSHQANMIFLNSPLNSLTPFIPQQQQQQQQQPHFVGIPIHHSYDSIRHNLWGCRPSSSTTDDTNPHNFEPPRSIQTRHPAQQGLSLSLTSPQKADAAGLQSVLMESKFLKAAQQLLDEVVSVVKPSKGDTVDPTSTTKNEKESDGGGDCDGDRQNKGADLNTIERQELQMKKAKLVNMLGEVEQRYRQYHQQIQTVVSSFEAVAGFGSARAYTALALQTISKQFRCLRDVIAGQIRAAGKSLGEEESRPGGSRLRFVDHQLRQQRALQQLGMIQHGAWRPQRGLPERAVSVLRAWLFEHFLHPYPKDSDKHMLAKQTGLTRSQVSNWFINARVRLWKPMVEEMYLEETKRHDHNNCDDKNTSKSEASQHSASKSTSPSRTEHSEGFNPTQDTNLDPVYSSRFESIMQQNLKKPRTDESIQESTIPNLMSMGMMKPDELSNRDLLMKFMDQGGGFGGYQLGDIARFEHEQFAPRFAANGVSLTLGLPHCEALSLSASQQPSYLSNESIPIRRRLDMSLEEGNYFSLDNGSNNAPSTSHTPNGYESINIQNRKRFAAQLRPDYVA